MAPTGKYTSKYQIKLSRIPNANSHRLNRHSIQPNDLHLLVAQSYVRSYWHVLMIGPDDLHDAHMKQQR